MSVAAPAAPTAAYTPPSPALRAASPSGRGDVRWLCGLAVALVVLCGLPYVLSALFGPADLERLGTFWFSRDFSQYAAAMREGARQSSWLIHDHFSAEPHTAALMYPLYVAAGKFAAVFGLDDQRGQPSCRSECDPRTLVDWCPEEG